MKPIRILFALALLLPLSAFAQSNFTREATSLRAGPDRAFPVVTRLSSRTSVRVFGCVSGRRWCDVAAGRNRGWIESRHLANSVRGAPIVNFSLGSYWDRHYRGRPWDSNRNQWSNWNSPSFRPPPPPPMRPPNRS